MEGQMEGKKVVVLATHFVRGQPFSLVSGRLHSWVVVLNGGRWSSCVGVIVVCVVVGGRGCCPWGWVVFMGAVSSFVELVRRQCTSFVADVHGLWLSYMRGVGAVVRH